MRRLILTAFSAQFRKNIARLLMNTPLKDIGMWDLITVIFCYRNLVKPLKTLKFSWVSSLLHLVSCYIILPLVMTCDKGKNKGKKIGTNFEILD